MTKPAAVAAISKKAMAEANANFAFSESAFFTEQGLERFAFANAITPWQRTKSQL